jgi:hypothetical protein
MKTVVGIFGSPSAAERAAKDLVNAGLPAARIRRLEPGSSEGAIHGLIPTSETEQSGMGKAIGGLVGFVVAATVALGLFGVLRGAMGQLTTAVLLGAAAAGVCGAIAGAIAGGALEDRMSAGLPKDEIYFYEEALRLGRSVVFFFAGNGRQEEAARSALAQAGANSLDAGDESWRVGLSPAAVHQRTEGRRAS